MTVAGRASQRPGRPVEECDREGAADCRPLARAQGGPQGSDRQKKRLKDELIEEKHKVVEATA
jgi:hypothetical protein